MNNLKFRAYIKSIQKIVDVLEIDFKNKMATLDIATNKVYPEFSFWWKETELPFSDIEIMQSTGYKDRKCTEIFIGDIVKIYVEDREEHKVYYSLCKVVFDEETTATKLEIIERFCDMLMPPKYLFLKNVEDIVIAGNIYENKELLR